MKLRNRKSTTVLFLFGIVLLSPLHAATVTWDAGTNAVWTGPSDATSWTGATYNDGDDAQFLGAGTGTVTMTGVVNPLSVTVNSGAAADYTFTGIGIGGAATLTKSGASRLFLNTANTYTGVTTITGGQIRISHADALGTTAGETIIGSGTKLELVGDLTVAEPITNQGGGNGKISTISGTQTFTGPITLEGSIDIRNSNYVFQGGFTNLTNQGIGFNGSNYIVETTPITIGTGGFGVTSAGNSAANATEINVGGNDWGQTTINFSGYLKVGGNDFLPTDTEVRFGWNWWSRSSGTLDLNGNDQTVRSLGPNGNSFGLGGDQKVTGLAGDVLTINLDAASTNDTYQGRFEGGLSVVKDGDGTLILENLSSTTAPAVNSDPSPGPAVPSSNTGSFTINAGVVESRAVYGASDAITFSDTSSVILAGGTLNLNYAGTDQISALDLGSGFVANGVYDATTSPGLITGTGSLTVAPPPAPRTWDGSTNTTWTGPSDNTSWSGDVYNDGDFASFLGAGAGTVTISGTVEPGSITVNSANAYTLSGGVIGGATGLTKSGSGDLTLTGVNTFTGNTTLSDDSYFTIDGAGQLGGGSYAANLTINNTSTFEYSSTADQVITGKVGGTGTGGLVKSEASTLDILMKSGLYTGPTTVNGGILRFTNEADLRGVGSPTFAINNGSTLEFQSNVGGANRTQLNNKVFTFDSGGGGTINFNGGNHLFQGGASTHTFTTTGGSKNTISRTNGGFMNMQGAGNVTFNVADGPDAVDLELSVVFNNGRLTKNGAGAMAITTTTSDNGGDNDIFINAGILEVSGSATLATDGIFQWDITNDATFIYNSSGIQTISGVISGTGALDKDNTGTLTLSGTNTYSGNTTVDGGTLSLGDGTNNTTLNDAADVSVATGAVLDLNYAGTDTIDQLLLGGIQAGGGTWGATGSGATNINDTFFTGTGTLTVVTGGTVYDNWAIANGLSGGDALSTADVESDGLVNLLEFGFGTDPNVADSASLATDGSVNGVPLPVAGGSGAGISFKLFFVRRDDHGASGSLIYTAQFSGDLVTFHDSTAPVTVEADSTDDAGYEIVSVPYPFILPDGKKARFSRVKVELVP